MQVALHQFREWVTRPSGLSLFSFLSLCIACSSMKKPSPDAVSRCAGDASTLVPDPARAEYIEAGRLLLQSGQPWQAAVWLFRPYQQGDRDLVLRHLLAEALKKSSELSIALADGGIEHGDLRKDGRLAALVDSEGTIKLYHPGSGRLLQVLTDIELKVSSGFHCRPTVVTCCCMGRGTGKLLRGLI